MTHRYALCTLLVGCQFVICACAQSPARENEIPSITDVLPNNGVTSLGSKIAVYGGGFSPDAVVYFGGLEARETRYVSSSKVEAVTPYLRPGDYKISVKSGGSIARSDMTFKALPSKVDSDIDHAMAQAGKDQPNSAIALLAGIATTNNDYQVRAFTHYEAAQIYYSRGDLWRWRAEAASIYDDSSKSGNAVQTWWRYRLAVQLGDYYLDVNPDLRHDLILANFTVEYDVTENPEPRFYRALINARYGNFREAKSDSEFILKVEPQNPSYRALAAYIAVLEGDKTLLQSFHGESIAEVRALAVLGESAYIGGDMRAAQLWWASAAKEYPLGAILAYYAGKKHLALGHQQVAASLLAECVTMAPDTKEAKDAKELLANLQSPDP